MHLRGEILSSLLSRASVGKAAVAVISVTLLLLLSVLAAWLTASYRTAVQRGDERVTAAAKIVAANANWLNSLARETLHRIDNSLGPKIPVADENRIHDLNSAVADLPTLVSAYVVSANGNTLFSSNREIESIPATDRDYFVRLKNGADEYTSSLITDRVSEHHFFVFSRRLERNGAFAGIAVIAFDASIMKPIRDAVDLGANSTVSLLRRDGKLVARSPESNGAVNMQDYVLFTDYLRKATSGVYRSSSPIDQKERIVGYRILDRTPFVAVASADIDVIMRPFWTDLRTAALLITLAIGGAIAAAWWISSLIRNDALHTKELATALESNRMLMREIHHRVKNNMQTVMALIRMQGFDPNDASQLNDRILAMSAVHEQMYGFDQFSGVSARQFIPGFVSKLVDVHGRNITTEFDVDDIIIGADNATPLALLLNELVANSMKYAFNNRSEGRIAVRLKKTETSSVELTVADNGSGFDGKPDNPGMGTKLINAFVSQMKGKSHYLLKDGTVFRANLRIIE
jgi:two-component sensor histidine kinase